MVDFGIFRFFGGIVYWVMSGFKMSFSDSMEKQYSVIVGFVFITALILILVQLW